MGGPGCGPGGGPECGTGCCTGGVGRDPVAGVTGCRLDTPDSFLSEIDGTPCRRGLAGRDTTGTVTVTGADWEGVVATEAVALGVGAGAAAVGLVVVGVGRVGVVVNVGAVVVGA
jgi:hypothetical protein